MRFLLRLMALVVLLALGAAAAAAWWLQRPLPLASDTVELSVEPSTAGASVCLFYAQQGVQRVEVSKSAKKTLDSRARDKNCVP